MKKLFIISALAANVLAVGAKDIKTVVFTTQPQMHCASCENRIKGNVRFVKGVKQIETNVEKQRVTIQYDAEKTTPEKIKEGFKKIGYEVKQVEPKKETKKQ
ncbi:MAG: heavy-metal-associated domain-containing protein [Prevotella sp.]|nr:heavy-metal-associated domain-containing protein [Prevotella sp.]